MNLMTTMKFNKQEILEQLRKGNTEVLKGLPPAMIMGYGIALQNESGDYREPSPIDDKEVAKAVVDRLKDSGVKEMLLKQIEQEEKEYTEKVALAKEKNSLA
ncbi:hypothetical protein [Peribacillus loiseleuriae]|uniref:hypothetical protein n=1 Tax=Peribacillus loiseleuriae TaxID=1679170 RepID=UPI003CFE820C